MQEEFSDVVKRHIDQVVEVYIDKGIVTRKDLECMDIRPTAGKLFSALRNKGYVDANIAEIGTQNYYDYSYVIFNMDMFTHEEAKEYMIKYVLID